MYIYVLVYQQLRVSLVDLSANVGNYINIKKQISELNSSDIK